ncbi:hypothetical protein HJG60_010757 [Phyllostomus discolor]|uniref:Uncharacterized protein n=1 Tax=Phyllostomus discolor TaxID=89673 RepID=A0A834A6L2_9CHIR|nr:hypothetical protein HJG60_010757 [Phyllostomus discolor]
MKRGPTCTRRGARQQEEPSELSPASLLVDPEAAPAPAREYSAEPWRALRVSAEGLIRKPSRGDKPPRGGDTVGSLQFEGKSPALAARASTAPRACAADLQWVQRARESCTDLRAGPGAVYNTDLGMPNLKPSSSKVTAGKRQN